MSLEVLSARPTHPVWALTLFIRNSEKWTSSAAQATPCLIAWRAREPALPPAEPCRQVPRSPGESSTPLPLLPSPWPTGPLLVQCPRSRAHRPRPIPCCLLSRNPDAPRVRHYHTPDHTIRRRAPMATSLAFGPEQ